jgi:hypothetical protein
MHMSMNISININLIIKVDMDMYSGTDIDMDRDMDTEQYALKSSGTNIKPGVLAPTTTRNRREQQIKVSGWSRAP